MKDYCLDFQAQTIKLQKKVNNMYSVAHTLLENDHDNIVSESFKIIHKQITLDLLIFDEVIGINHCVLFA